MPDDIATHVNRALDNALTNGYDLRSVPVEEVAIDLLTCDADLENEVIAVVEPLVAAWQKKNART